MEASGGVNPDKRKAATPKPFKGRKDGGMRESEQGRKQDEQMVDYLGCWFSSRVALCLPLEPGQTKKQAYKPGEL